MRSFSKIVGRWHDHHEGNRVPCESGSVHVHAVQPVPPHRWVGHALSEWLCVVTSVDRPRYTHTRGRFAAAARCWHHVATTLLALLALTSAAHAGFNENPQTVRLAFWIDPARHDDFSLRFDETILPPLIEHGFKPSAATPPPTQDSVFSRLYDFPSGAAADSAFASVFGDSTTNEPFYDLLTDFDVDLDDQRYRHSTWFHMISSRLPVDPEAPDRPGGLPDRVVTTGPGRPANVDVSEGTWHSWDVDNGLHSGYVTDLLQDRDGHIWAATAGGGISRFDGDRWTTWTKADGLPSDWFSELVEDGNGNIWAAGYGESETYHGVSRFDGQYWRTFSTVDGLLQNSISAMSADAQGSIWFGACDDHGLGTGRLGRFDGLTFQMVPTDDLPNTCIDDLHHDGAGVLWVATRDGLGRLNPAGWQHVPYPAAWGLANARITSHGNNLWVHAQIFLSDVDLDQRMESSPVHRGHDEIVARFDGTRFHPPIGHFSGTSHAVPILVDHDGSVWVGSLADGLNRYRDGRWTHFGIEEGLLSDRVRMILEDREGNV